VPSGAANLRTHYTRQPKGREGIMKKEIKAMLTESKNVKSLDINGAFRLESLTAHDYVSKQPIEVMLILRYQIKHDELSFMSRNIYTRPIDKDITPEMIDVVTETIRYAMLSMLKEVANALDNQFSNGYLLGTVKEES
jgi:hypothetical protein